MTMSTLLRVLVLLAVTIGAFAADVNGKWTAQIPGREGQTREATFTFKVEGDKLTGSMSGRQGDTPLADGKVTGDTISFAVETQRGKQNYTGTIAGDEIKFKQMRQQGEPREFVAKRAK
jgi:hypothetical protein